MESWKRWVPATKKARPKGTGRRCLCCRELVARLPGHTQNAPTRRAVTVMRMMVGGAADVHGTGRLATQTGPVKGGGGGWGLGAGGARE